MISTCYSAMLDYAIILLGYTQGYIHVYNVYSILLKPYGTYVHTSDIHISALLVNFINDILQFNSRVSKIH